MHFFKCSVGAYPFSMEVCLKYTIKKMETPIIYLLGLKVWSKETLSFYMHHHCQESQIVILLWFLHFNHRIIRFSCLILNIDHILFLNIDIENIQHNIMNVSVFLGKPFSRGSEEVLKRQKNSAECNSKTLL